MIKKFLGIQPEYEECDNAAFIGYKTRCSTTLDCWAGSVKGYSRYNVIYDVRNGMTCEEDYISCTTKC